MSNQNARSVFVRLRRRRLDQTVPPELLAALAMEPGDVCRAGTLGFTAMLSDVQRAKAGRQSLVAALEDNPECLAPFDRPEREPDVPNRYVVCVLRSEKVPTVLAQVDLVAAEVLITGVWFYATLTADQLDVVRRLPDVDFVAPAVMVRPVSE